MTVIDEFYEAYLHYSVALRLWMDTCRQLATCKGTLEERQALTDESLTDDSGFESHETAIRKWF